MTLHYHMGREDVLALNREYYRSSPSYRKMRLRVQVTLPVIMLAFWIFTTVSSGFDLTGTGIYVGIGLTWFFYYPLRFDRNVMKHTERTLDEASFVKLLGPCELILTENGLQSKSAMGESSYPWPSVERALMTDTHMILFLAGNLGYPIPISQIGMETAQAAHDFAMRHMASHRE